jgi:hypothetical protein
LAEGIDAARVLEDVVFSDNEVNFTDLSR